MAVEVTQQRRPVEFVRHVSVPVDIAVAILGREPQRVIGSRLGVDLLGGRQVTRDVRVGYGKLLDDDGVTAVPVWWEDAEHPELFPTFDGGLELRPAPAGTELRLVGSYQPPLGALGRFADSLVGHRIVMGSLEQLLSSIVTRLERAAAGSGEASTV